MAAYPKQSYKWAFFDVGNNQHMKIFSVCRELEWVYYNEKKQKTLVDLNRLGNWLKSEKSPVKKPLKEMDTTELTKIINALTNMTGQKYV